MNKNDIITLEITSLTNEGFGFGKYEGMAVFVPFTAVRDVIQARLVKVNKSYAYAKIEQIITPSPDRIESTCPAFGKCGGCAFRHISCEAELRAKEIFVKDAFMKLGGFSTENIEFLPVFPSENRERYRNKLEMPFGKDENSVFLGFFAPRSHRVVPVSDCLLQPEIFSKITEFAAKTALELKISVYDEQRHEGVLRHIFLRKSTNLADGGLCCVITAKRKTPEILKLLREIYEKFPEITGAVLNINPEKTNVILGEKEILVCGRAEIYDEMCGIRVEISPKSFYQVNTRAAENLYRQAAEFAEPRGKTILDLYCGAGTIGLSMSAQAGKLIGAEIVVQAVENARKNAERAGISNAEFICADAGDAAKTLVSRGIKPDVIILDPPRKGCGEEVVSACRQLCPDRIVMISCNPSTAARDCKRFYEAGFAPRIVRAFDLFPGTKHVEAVILLTKSS